MSTNETKPCHTHGGPPPKGAKAGDVWITDSGDTFHHNGAGFFRVVDTDPYRRTLNPGETWTFSPLTTKHTLSLIHI